MCIRDRLAPQQVVVLRRFGSIIDQKTPHSASEIIAQMMSCLLYTSDAADERSSVDLGGRRIIKKKKTLHTSRHGRASTLSAVIAEQK